MFPIHNTYEKARFDDIVRNVEIQQLLRDDPEKLMVTESSFHSRSAIINTLLVFLVVISRTLFPLDIHLGL